MAFDSYLFELMLGFFLGGFAIGSALGFTAGIFGAVWSGFKAIIST